MLTRRLGRTGHESSVAVAGGIAFHFTEGWEDAEALLHRFLDAGVNHLDIAPGYQTAEAKVGPLLPAVRDRLFVACKTAMPGREEARRELESSLRMLRCGAFDLYQLHGVTSVAELDRRSGAAEAILAARDEGMCRFVGITGHDVGAPAALAEAVRRYDLDTVMFPVLPRMWTDVAYRRNAEALLDLCAARDVGVLAIKAAAARPWSGDDRHATTWYEPYATTDEVARGVRFTLSVPGVHAFCTPGDLAVLPLALDAARSFEPLDEHGRQAAVDAVAGEPPLFPLPA